MAARAGCRAARRKRLNKYTSGNGAPSHPFLHHIEALLEKRYADHRFQSSIFAQEAGMIKSQLHRKLTAPTGASASQFIRHFRLQKAKDLLLQAALRRRRISPMPFPGLLAFAPRHFGPFLAPPQKKSCAFSGAASR